MTSPTLFSPANATPHAVLVCLAALLSLAIAMGVGRFAFTPLFPLMVRDGLLGSQAGALLAASNYLGYLIGALVATRLRVASASLLILGLVATVLVTAAMGWTSSVPVWAALRLVAGVLSAWTLVATSAWGLGWLAALGRPHLAGTIFAGVGLGIAAAGLFCLALSASALSAQGMWIGLACLAAVAVAWPLTVARRWPAPGIAAGSPSRQEAAHASGTSGTIGLVVCYALFGFGYILPATYLPAMAQQLMDDPRVFGLAWPLFGSAAAVSTLVVAWRLRTASRVKVWAVSHLVMAAGVLLPAIWPTLASVAVSALLVGGTFMVITMAGMQEARSRIQGDATAVLGRMTAGFAFGQLMGPIASAAIAHIGAGQTSALHHALSLSAAGLLASAGWLWRQRPHHPLSRQEHQ